MGHVSFAYPSGLLIETTVRNKVIKCFLKNIFIYAKTNPNSGIIFSKNPTLCIKITAIVI